MQIAVVAPSRSLDPAVPEMVQACTPPGFDVDFHPQCFLCHGHFAGRDEERAAAFIEVANNPDYDVVWMARGGYGACRILNEVLPNLGEAARQKTYIGYSDAGFLLGALYKHGIGQPVHGPMTMDGVFYKDAGPINRVFDFLQTGAGIEASCGDELQVAFTVQILANLTATPYMPKLQDHIVMLEEVGEHLYAIDRSLFSIMHSPRMKGAKGIKLGRVVDVPENNIAFGQTAEEIVQRWCDKTGIPYLGRADIGHDAQNKIVPFGLTTARL